jgi:hypothetical protein
LLFTFASAARLQDSLAPRRSCMDALGDGDRELAGRTLGRRRRVGEMAAGRGGPARCLTRAGAPPGDGFDGSSSPATLADVRRRRRLPAILGARKNYVRIDDWTCKRESYGQRKTKEGRGSSWSATLRCLRSVTRRQRKAFLIEREGESRAAVF